MITNDCKITELKSFILSNWILIALGIFNFIASIMNNCDGFYMALSVLFLSSSFIIHLYIENSSLKRRLDQIEKK